MPEYSTSTYTPSVFFGIPDVTGQVDLIIYEGEDYWMLGRMAIEI